MHLTRFSPILGLVVLFTASPLYADEIPWRNDYTAARREAKEANRPLVMDFGTVNCTWCRKLDASTFRDPAIVKLINEQFVPVRIDADKSRDLANALNIKSFPTMVFAAPDGKILAVQEGFVDAATCNQLLRGAQTDSTARSPSAAPALVAVVAIEAPAAVNPSAPAPVRITVPPAEPVGVLPDRARVAHDLLTLAQDDFDNERFGCCLERCRSLVTAFGGLSEAATAQQLADKIKNNPDLGRKATQNLAAQLGDLYLGLAETALRNNQTQEATALLERVLVVCPGSGQAQVAQQHLNQLPSRLAGLPPLPKVRVQAQ